MFMKVRIASHLRGLWFRDGDFKGILPPGDYRFWRYPFRAYRDNVQIVSTLVTKLEHTLLDVIVRDPRAADELLVLNLGDNERAFVWRDDRLCYALGPGRHVFWREPFELSVETHDVNEFRFDHARLEAIAAFADARKHLLLVDVKPYETAMLFRDGRIVETLQEGRYAYWSAAGRLEVRTIDRREQVIDVAGQDIMTADKVTLRVNLLVAWSVSDPLKATTLVKDAEQALYRDAQLALRAAIGTRKLETLLTNKDAVGDELRQMLIKRAEQIGATIHAIGLKDIILPGEMKTILNRVIEAEKQAEANTIRRREETATVRSQLNTAKLLADNPHLARERELELLGEILRGTKATIVLGQGDIADQIRGMVGSLSS
ncbi:MAG TPA: slipin family protein [Phycisphaerae bacterium]|nr:slipin family protein [Phycisphaerae bacterium]HRW53329.1 slipin family protein [Phycisphaerae bacterium]